MKIIEKREEFGSDVLKWATEVMTHTNAIKDDLEDDMDEIISDFEDDVQDDSD